MYLKGTVSEEVIPLMPTDPIVEYTNTDNILVAFINEGGNLELMGNNVMWKKRF